MSGISKEDYVLIAIVSVVILIVDFYTGYEVSCPCCGFRGDIKDVPTHHIWTTWSSDVVCPRCNSNFRVLVYYGSYFGDHIYIDEVKCNVKTTD